VTFDLPVETAGKRGKHIAEAEKISESARWSSICEAAGLVTLPDLGSLSTGTCKMISQNMFFL
jgi:hypothetical protein